MKLFEYMGKELFLAYNIPIPKGKVVFTPLEAAGAAEMLGPVVLKVQVLAGKRGKAGGVASARDAEEAQKEAERLLKLEVGGSRASCLLVEQKMKIDREFYLAITIDTTGRCPVVLASTSGGMDIEDVPDEEMITCPIDVLMGLQPFMAREICRRLELNGDAAAGFSAILRNLYRLFQEKDAELVEINPLVLAGNSWTAVDAKITVDDDALVRQNNLPRVEERTELEKKAHESGLAFVQLNGDIGVMANGAGMSMATLDMLDYFGGRAANFLDAGGGAGAAQTARALELLLATRPKAVLINIFGGITRCDDVAEAFLQVQKEKNISVPVVFRLAGTNEEEGGAILREAGVQVYRNMGEAVRKAVELAKRGSGEGEK